MRRFDKKKQIEKANLLAEQRYLKSKGLLKENERWDMDASHRDDSSYNDFDPSDPSMAGDNDMSDEQINDEQAVQYLEGALSEMGIDNPLARHTTFYVDGLSDITAMIYDGREEEARQHASAIASQIYNKTNY